MIVLLNIFILFVLLGQMIMMLYIICEFADIKRELITRTKIEFRIKINKITNKFR